MIVRACQALQVSRPWAALFCFASGSRVTCPKVEHGGDETGNDDCPPDVTCDWEHPNLHLELNP